MLQITGYSVITAIYADDMMRYIGYIEMCVGVGLGVGPVMASFIQGQISSDSNISYPYTMYIFGGMDLLALTLCIFMIPNSLNQTISEEEIHQIEFEEDIQLDEQTIAKREKLKITWGTLLKNKYVVFSMLACFVGTFNIIFWTPFLSNHFSD